MLQLSILLMLGRQEESLWSDFIEDRPSGLDINNPFLTFTFPRTLLLTGLFVISTGHSFNPCSIIFSNDFTQFPFFFFLSIVKPTFLWWISVGFYRGLLGQELHSAFMARSCGEVTSVTSGRTELSSGGIKSCINQMLLFSLVWTKFNSKFTCGLGSAKWASYAALVWGSSCFETNGSTAEKLQVFMWIRLWFLRYHKLSFLQNPAGNSEEFCSSVVCVIYSWEYLDSLTYALDFLLIYLFV